MSHKSVEIVSNLIVQILDGLLRIIFKLFKKLGRFFENVSEFFPGPFNAVIDQVREGPNCAIRGLFLFRVLGVLIGLSKPRKNQLRVAFSSQRARLEQRFHMKDNFVVDVFSGLDVVHSIYY